VIHGGALAAAAAAMIREVVDFFLIKIIYYSVPGAGHEVVGLEIRKATWLAIGRDLKSK
jgi:hypothetical protein